jgi:hypothetical protein
MDAGNLAFGALVVGQWLAGGPFRWSVAGIGLAVWLVLSATGVALLYFESGET